MSVAECTRPMVDSPSGLAYSAYTTFYTHAESMCALRARPRPRTPPRPPAPPDGLKSSPSSPLVPQRLC